MPLLEKRLSPNRVQFEKNLSSREVEQLLYDLELHILQCNSPVDSRTWDRLDRDLFQNTIPCLRYPRSNMRLSGSEATEKIRVSMT